VRASLRNPCHLFCFDVFSNLLSHYHTRQCDVLCAFPFGTLGIGVLGIVFLIVAAWIGLVLFLWSCSDTLGVGAVSRGSVSADVLADSSNVTPLCVGLVVVVSGTDSGSLLRIVSKRLSASSCSSPFLLLFPFNACVKSFRRFQYYVGLSQGGLSDVFCLEEYRVWNSFAFGLFDVNHLALVMFWRRL
jgi:hypothetical protein